MIQIGLVGNGGRSAIKFEKYYDQFKELLFENTDKNYSASLSDLMIVICISGEIKDYKFEGFDRLRINRKKKQMWIDYGIKKDFFQDRSELFIKEYLIQIIDEALEKFFQRIEKEKIYFDRTLLLSDVQKVSAIFLRSCLEIKKNVTD